MLPVPEGPDMQFITRSHLLNSVVFIFVLSVLTVAGFAANSQNAFSRANAFCGEYLDKAREAINLNQDSRCGYTGPRWSPNYDEHLAFCERSNQEVVRSELSGRAHEAACCRYALNALDTVLRASQANCRFSGPRWSPNLSDHRDWCNSTQTSFTENESAVRKRDYDVCVRTRR